jgi:hypothetical protein
MKKRKTTVRTKNIFEGNKKYLERKNKKMSWHFFKKVTKKNYSKPVIFFCYYFILSQKIQLILKKKRPVTKKLLFINYYLALFFKHTNFLSFW